MATVVIVLAAISIVLYSSLAVTCAYFFRKFQLLREQGSDCEAATQGLLRWGGLSLRSSSNNGKFDDQKLLFFLVLAVSAMLDVPLYIGCIATGGPTDCEWDGLAYPILWCMHLIACTGYALSIILPAVLWSDILESKDGRIFLSKYPVDPTKRFFQVGTVCVSVSPRWLIVIL
jgi:hypothetical protein